MPLFAADVAQETPASEAGMGLFVPKAPQAPPKTIRDLDRALRAALRSAPPASLPDEELPPVLGVHVFAFVGSAWEYAA